MKVQRQSFRVVDDGINDLGGQGLGRIDGNAVAGMNPRAFHMLHDAGNDHVRTVGNPVHFHFRSFHVAVH